MEHLGQLHPFDVFLQFCSNYINQEMAPDYTEVRSNKLVFSRAKSDSVCLVL